MISVIIGLGNPGRKYESTRHNIGFEVADLIAAKFDRSFVQTHPDFLYASITHKTKPILLVKPLTFMNLSGKVAVLLKHRLEIDPEQMLAVVDDFNLPVGRIRIRKEGSDGGHNGLQSIANSLNNSAFPRLRMGVGPLPEGVDPASFVLGRFSESELEPVKKSLEIAAESAIFMAVHQIDEAMNRYNR
ncbi:MAG: aminoacyl-tRNA hydrolase [bacterium]|nr:aminoacyl-tRNA hydrolase [bacterium]